MNDIYFFNHVIIIITFYLKGIIVFGGRTFQNFLNDVFDFALFGYKINIRMCTS